MFMKEGTMRAVVKDISYDEMKCLQGYISFVFAAYLIISSFWLTHMSFASH